MHRRALAVASSFLGPAGDANWVFNILLARGRSRLHADLVAVVEERRAAAGEEDGGDDALDVGVVDAVAVAHVDALAAELGHVELVDHADLGVHR